MLKLVQLDSNQKSFHKIIFRDGLNIVLGIQDKSKNTYNNTLNGLGKSLIIKIIDFCLGSEKNRNWEKPLSNWSFSLTIEVDGISHVLTRTISKSNTIVIDGESFNIKKTREILHNYIKVDDKYSFRQIVTRFMRKGKTGYNNYLSFVKGEKETDTKEILIYLLGLNSSLCALKRQLKQKIDANNSLIKNKKIRVTLANAIGSELQNNLELELSDINFKINKIEENIRNTKFAENYLEVLQSADATSNDIDNMQNEMFIINANIKEIKESLSLNSEDNLNEITKIYNDFGISFSEKIIKSLEQIQDFHKKLVEKRKESLTKDLNELNDKASTLKLKLNELTRELNSKLEFLKTHTAIDKYASATRRIENLKSRKKEIEKINNLEKNIKEIIQKTKGELSKSNLEAQKYLDNTSNKLNELNDTFVAFAKRFYTNKKSALIIKNNDGDNQNRFDIEARITSDGSDGIQEIITFCFDLVMLKQKITNLGFLYHDSLLFANIEQRQRETLFNVINDFCKENNFQYIINIDFDQINAFDDKTIRILNDAKILELTDKDASSKLLGIEVDLGREMDEEEIDSK